MKPVDILIRPSIECTTIQGCTEAGIQLVKEVASGDTPHVGFKKLSDDAQIQEIFDLIDGYGLTSLMT